MSRKIIVPIDGSEQSFKAINIVAQLAGDKDDEVILLNVVGRGKFPEAVKKYVQMENIEGPPEWQYEQLLASGVLNAGQDHARDKGIERVSTSVRTGDPARTITRFAKEESADMIVMGSRGLGAAKGLAFGSVSQKVSSNAPCSVLTVS